MPSYKLDHGTATGKKGCGNLVVNQSGTSKPTIINNPPGNGPGVQILDYNYNSPSGNGTVMNPVAGDTLNLGGYTLSVDGTTFSFNNNATYRLAGNGQKGGYFTVPGPTGGQQDWDAADGGDK